MDKRVYFILTVDAADVCRPSYDFTEQQCQLFSEPDYLSRCNVVVGRSWDDDITVSNCTEPSQATCDSFVSAGVTFSQDPVQSVQVDTADQCLEALKGSCNNINCAAKAPGKPIGTSTYDVVHFGPGVLHVPVSLLV